MIGKANFITPYFTPNPSPPEDGHIILSPLKCRMARNFTSVETDCRFGILQRPANYTLFISNV